jgi:hypothetical protein
MIYHQQHDAFRVPTECGGVFLHPFERQYFWEQPFPSTEVFFIAEKPMYGLSSRDS